MVSIAGLRFDTNLSSALVPTLTFEPSIGISAGKLLAMSAGIESMKDPLTQAVKEVMTKSIAQNFATGGRPTWEPLSEATVSIRGSSEPVLVRSGNLARVAITEDIWTITDKAAIIRDLPDDVWYGKVHQAGYEGASMSALIKKHGGDISAAMEAHTNSLLNALAGTEDLTGQSRTSPSIPARPFLDFQDEDEDDIERIFENWLGVEFDKAWPPGT